MNEVEFHIGRLAARDFPTRRMSAEMLGVLGDPAGIKPLLQLLGDDFWQVRNTVVEALVKIRDKTSIEHLVECLRDEDPGVRSSAMSVLNEMGEDVAAPLSRLLAHDGSEDVRIFSANTLGKLRRRAAVAGLVAGLRDADGNVRFACAEGLGNLGFPDAVEPLIAAMRREDTWSRFPYIASLGLIGDERACPVLMEALADEVLCYPAVVALGQIGDVSALPSMVDLLHARPEPSIARAALVCLAQMERKTAYLSKVERQGFFHSRVAEEIKKLDQPWVAGLLVDMALGGTELESRSALGMLLQVRGHIPVEKLFPLMDDETLEEQVREIIVRQGEGAIPAVMEALKSGEAGKQSQLLRVAGLLGSDAEVPALAPLLDSPSPETVCEALKALGMLNATGSFGRMTELLSAPDENVRNAAVGGIALLRKKGNLLGKVIALVRSPDEYVRRGGYRILGYQSNVEALEFLVTGLADESALARGAAVQSLGYIGVNNARLVENADHFAALGRLMLDEDKEVRVEAVLAYARINHPETHRLLLDMLEREDREVQSHVIRAVGKCRIAAAAPALCRLLEKENDIEMMIFICSALGNCGGPEAVPSLFGLMDDPTPELAAEAIIARGRIGGEGAVEDVLRQLESDSWMVCDAAIAALGEMDAMTAGHRLAELVSSLAPDGEGVLLRRAAIRVLGKIGGPDEVETVIANLGDPSCQYEAFAALKGIWSRGRAPYGLARIENPAARRLACAVSGLVDGAGAAKDVFECLADRYPSVRRAAVFALMKYDFPEVRAALAGAAAEDADYWVKEVLRKHFSSLEGT